MLNLLKNDLLRIIKDKTIIVIIAITVSLAFARPLISALPGFIYNQLNPENKINVREQAAAFDLFLESFSINGAVGILAPIFLIILIAKDINFGTIRNKIILGYSRTKIYLSYLLTAFISMVVIMFGYAILTLLFSLAFFNPFANNIDVGQYIGFIFLMLFVYLILYAFIISFVLFTRISLKGNASTIAIYIVVILSLELLGVTCFAISEFFIDINGNVSFNIFTFLSNINPIYYIGETSSLDKFYLSDLLWMTIPTLIYASLNIFFGLLIINKKDIK